MRPRIAILIVIATASLLLFGYVLRQLSFLSIGFAASREVEPLLRQSLEDQKKLARLDPQHAAAHRERFESIRTVISNLDIVALTSREITRRIELVLVGVVAFIIIAIALIYLGEHRGRERRMADLGAALAANERRVRTLENLESWQEAARRHAHEIRTPLTAAQLEVRSLVAKLAKEHPQDAESLGAAETSILEELEQLRRFTASFSSFATIGRPQLQSQDVAGFVEEFCAKFAPSWTTLALSVAPARGRCRANIDRDMMRRVLVNLCTNSAAAGSANIRMSVDGDSATVHVTVSDDGPGVSPKIRARLFEPYTTTRRIGEGMGLGLAISRKILLDHGGDLEYVDADRGATFRLVLPAAEDAA